MDYKKLDSALTLALAGEGTKPRRVTVFVRADPQRAADMKEFLDSYGYGTSSAGAPVFSADLLPEQISDLSDQPWVTSISLARVARPLPG